MKASIYFFLIAALLIYCKKSKNPDCELSMIAVSGNYHLIKSEQVAFTTGTATDVTNNLNNCELSGVYNFKADSTITYTEPVTCNGNGSGKWSVAQGNLSISFSSGEGTIINFTTLVSWDCTNLVLITHYPSTSFNNRFTLAKF